MRRYLDFYLTSMKIAIQSDFQYPLVEYFYMIGMIAEPIIYLVVWSTIAASQGGQVGGYTAGQFAAYYIVWTLVRNINIVLTPYDWERRIRQGQLSMELMRPIHPLHSDIASIAGMKIVVIILWLPLAAALTLIFKPELNPSLLDILVFFFALWGAYLVRTMAVSLLAMLTFWTTRVGAIFELYFALELLLSGRLVPMSLMPAWVQQIANFLPFKWAFQFPIDALVGHLPAAQLLSGLGVQLFWIILTALIVSVAWRFAIRHYSAVGG